LAKFHPAGISFGQRFLASISFGQYLLTDILFGQYLMQLTNIFLANPKFSYFAKKVWYLLI